MANRADCNEFAFVHDCDAISNSGRNYRILRRHEKSAAFSVLDDRINHLVFGVWVDAFEWATEYDKLGTTNESHTQSKATQLSVSQVLSRFVCLILKQ